MSTLNIPIPPFFVHNFLKTTQLSCRRKQFNSPPQLENQNHYRRKTTQLSRRKTTNLDNRNETTQLSRRNNSTAGTKQLDSAPPLTACNRLHQLYSRIGFFYLLMSVSTSPWTFIALNHSFPKWSI
ncbi:hypothetical protein TNCV_1080311 [Trichonephila clavipes]|nr:hypothetical protein TNCV_1080311 [Trichonephila clavipes]